MGAVVTEGGAGRKSKPLAARHPPAEAGGMTDLSHLALPGARIALRVTPRARRNEISVVDGAIRAHVTAAPEDGRANEAVVRLLARAMGVARSRLVLVRGATSRDKLFRLD